MHVHSASCLHTFAASNRVDPTRTTALRRKFEADMVRRFKRVRKQIPDRLEAIMAQRASFNSEGTANAFEFSLDGRKIADFMDWLESAQARELFGVEKGTSISQSASRSWQNVYLRAAYQKGVALAASQMRKGAIEVAERWITAALTRPVHADRAGIIYTRAYTALRGVTQAMDGQISRVLAEGAALGYAPKKIAREIVDRVDKIGITRARVIARTEIINSHAEASLNSYAEAGLEGVNAQSEFATANDNKVCPQCEDLEGKVYTIEDARGVIPVHPNCRCAWLPVIDVPKGIVLK
jgi:SPP1 gp7 family putative phage head morphogenesis protein